VVDSITNNKTIRDALRTEDTETTRDPTQKSYFINLSNPA